MRLATHQIMLYSRSALTQPSTLISLAAYNWWLDLLTQESLTPSSCHSVGSALIRAADRQGQLDLSRVAGRGFFRNDNNRYVWNLGDRLLVDGREGELDSLQDGWHYVNGPRIEVAEKRAGHGERKRVAEAVERYRWQHPLDGRRFLGWLVSSIVGGALEWRPHIWLAAAAETGKSWLLKRVAARLLGPMVVRVADATPAAMARRMRSDSLPLILDEAEPDRQWIDPAYTACSNSGTCRSLPPGWLCRSVVPCWTRPASKGGIGFSLSGKEAAGTMLAPRPSAPPCANSWACN